MFIVKSNCLIVKLFLLANFIDESPFSLSMQAEPSDKPVENGFAEDGATDGVDEAAEGIKELTFEEDEEDQAFYTKDLPTHACK